MKLLIVDDEINACQAIRVLLKNTTLDISGIWDAHSGAYGLELLKAVQPDIVFVDMKMPQMSGMEFLENAKERGYKGKIIVLSGYDDYAFMRSAITNGASDYLLKPIDRETLYTVLENAIAEITQTTQEEKERTRLTEISFSAAQIGVWQQLLAADKNLSYENNHVLSILNLSVGSIWFGCVMTGQNIDDGTWETILYSYSPYKKTPHYWDGANKRLFLLSSQLQWEQSDWKEFLLFLRTCLKKQHCPATVFFGLLPTIKDFPLLMQTMECGWKNINILFAVPDFVDLNVPMISVPSIDSSALSFNILNKSLEAGSLVQSLTIIRDLCHIVEETGYISYSLEQSIYSRLYLGLKDLYGKNLFVRIAHSSGITFDSQLEFPLVLKDFSDLLENIIIYSIRTTFSIHAITSDELVEKIKSHIQNHYREKITLNDYVGMFYLSREHIVRTFKKKCGISLHQYLIETRMKNSQKLLSNSDAKIYEIAQIVGYDNARYFCQAFKKFCGMTPEQYRQITYSPQINQNN